MRTPPGRLTGHQEPSPLRRYAAAVDRYRAALHELIAATGALAVDVGADPTELIELARLSLHLEADRFVDEVELTLPEPGRTIARTPSYLDITKETTA